MFTESIDGPVVSEEYMAEVEKEDNLNKDNELRYLRDQLAASIVGALLQKSAQTTTKWMPDQAAKMIAATYDWADLMLVERMRPLPDGCK